MGDPNTGRIYDLEEGQQPEPGHVPLTAEQSERLNGMPTAERIRTLQEMARGGNAYTQQGAATATQTARDETTKYTILDVAMVTHEANRALCQAAGDYTQTSWETAPNWQRESAVNGVRFTLDNPTAAPSANHENWMKEKMADGWRYGETKDAEAKTHPCLVPFEALPPHQQAKDHLFRAVVAALAPFVERTAS
jgi:hypothetical protein